MEGKTLKEKTAQGLFWGAINNGVQQVLVLVFGIVLGRLLSPEEYGLVGMLTIFTLIGNSLQESGFRAALVNLKEIRHADYNAVFWCSTLIGCTAYLVLFFCAPLLARFYHEPLLTPLARYCFLAIPIASLGTVQGAYLFRNLQVRQQALSGIIAHILSGSVGVTLAFNGFSYWGIATQSLTYLVVITCCSWYFSAWHPTLHIDFTPIKPLFSFSSKLLVTNIANQLNNNLLSVILGKHFNAATVGNYNQANKWNATGHLFITGMLNGVAQPVLASIRDDRERASRIFRKILRFTAFIAFPCMFGLSIVTRELILSAIGTKWNDAIPLMQLLCVGGAFIPINTLFSNLIISQGKSTIYMWNIISQVLLQLMAAIAVITTNGDIYTMVILYACITICWLFIWRHQAARFIQLSFGNLCTDLLPFLLSALFSCGVGWLAASFCSSLWITFPVKVLIAVSCYLTLMRLTHADILKECLHYLQKKKS